jgi:hypothetical protein
MDCYGCAVMDPWRHMVSNIHTTTPPFVPSAALGMYAEMLQAWLAFFPSENMHIINYKQLVEKPFESVNRMLREIGTAHLERSNLPI